VHPLGGEESYLYWAEKGAAFNLWYFMKKGRQLFRLQWSASPAKILATPMAGNNNELSAK